MDWTMANVSRGNNIVICNYKLCEKEQQLLVFYCVHLIWKLQRIVFIGKLFGALNVCLGMFFQ